jgi:hypothetical protein
VGGRFPPRQERDGLDATWRGRRPARSRRRIEHWRSILARLENVAEDLDDALAAYDDLDALATDATWLRVEEVLLRAATDRSPNVRTWAASGLRKRPSKAARAAFRTLRNDPDASVRSYARAKFPD